MGIKLTINGVQIEAKPGQKILEAAKDHGIRIPHLCYHGQIGSIGSCRICLVEVKPGPPKPVPACTTTVAEGMEVQTHTERVVALRRELVQLMLLNHPLDCPICDAAGECKLQQVVHELGITEQKWQATPTRSEIDYDSPLIERHPERCIHCGRCVTICERIIGAEGIYFAGRGYDTEVAAGGRPLDCEFCGSCVAVCPVGALIDKTFKYRARSWQLEKRETTCPYCAGGCRLELNVADNQVRRVTSNHKKTFNRGLLCGRGRFGHGFVGSGERLKTPLVRKRGELVPASWEEAIGAAASGLQAVREKTGAVSIYALGSPRVSTEAGYLLQKLVRVGLNTHHIDTQARYGYLPAIGALAEAFGPPDVREGKLCGLAARLGRFADIGAADCVLVFGADARPELPSASLAVIAAARAGAQVCVAGLRATKLDRFATQVLRYGPGEELGLLAALLKALLPGAPTDAPGLAELGARLEGKQFFELVHKKGSPSSDITQADVEVLAAVLAGASSPVVVFGADLFATGQAQAKARALASLVVLLGPEARIVPLAPKANSLGALMAGCAPEMLPGLLPLSAAQAAERRWGTKLGASRLTFPEAVSGGKLRALYCLGANPLLGWPNTPAIEAALERLEFLVVQDLFLTGTAAKADVVLPAASFAAGSGTFINAEGRPGRLAAAVEEPQLLADWEIVAALSRALGLKADYASAAEVWAEFAELVPLYGLPFEEAQALPRELGGSLGKLELPEAGAAGAGGFTLLVAGSLFHSGTLSTHAPGACAVERAGRVLMSRQDYDRLGLSGEVLLSAGGERLVAQVSASSQLPPGLIFAPDHFAGLPIHRLTTEGCLARVEAANPRAPKGGAR